MADVVEVGGREYRIRKMDVRTQFHVARRLIASLAPLAGQLGDMAKALPAEGGASDERLAAQVFAQAAPEIAKVIADLPDADCDYVLDRCLEVVDRREGDRFLPVWNKQAKRVQYEDVDLTTQLTLVANVVGENLGDFFGGLASLTLG